MREITQDLNLETELKNLTEKKALWLTACMWKWIADNPDKGKEDWLHLQVKPSEYLAFNCFLCEYVARKKGSLSESFIGGADVCESCPLYGRFEKDTPFKHFSWCQSENSPYEKWRTIQYLQSDGKWLSDKEYLNLKSTYANQIVDLCIEKLKELEDGK